MTEPRQFCPRCSRTYPWYEDACPECGLGLRPIPEDERPDPDIELVPILETTERGLLPLVRATLEKDCIDHTVEDRGFNVDLVGRRSSALIGETEAPFRVLVRREDAARARDALEVVDHPGRV